MSKGRMQDLQIRLSEAGWDVVNEDELYSIEDEVIVWHLANRERKLAIEAEFYLVGHLGERSHDLNDLVHCRIRGHDIEMLFPRKNTDSWRSEVDKFVMALKSIAS